MDAGYHGAPLPPEVRARILPGVNGLDMHVLEAGEAGNPLVLLLHGFPELAYSWRKTMPALAAAGYHVVAPDQRGYGLTTGWAGGYDVDLRAFGMFGLVRDCMALVAALGQRRCAAVVGHDFGSPLAGWAALVRPDIFGAVALMSAPFPGPPAFGGGGGEGQAGAPPAGMALAEGLAALRRARKHYQHYYAGRAADADMRQAPQGLHAFLRAYYHMKSGDWAANRPVPLRDWSAAELAKLPTYYVMEAGQNMAETVAPEMPSADEIAACRWLPDAELAVYARVFAATGFQGGLNWYRAMQDPGIAAEFGLFAGRGIEVPSLFVAGAVDWGIHQAPGALAAMQGSGCRDLRGLHLLGGAGHWVQQERPEEVAELLLRFLREVAG